MAVDKYHFYSKHYHDIAQVLELESEVTERYPQHLWHKLQELLSDRFVSTFAGKIGWHSNDEDDGPEDWIAFWHPDFMSDDGCGPYFLINGLKKCGSRVRSTEAHNLKNLVVCYLAIDKSGGPWKVSGKTLVAAARSQQKRLKGLKFDAAPAHADCFVSIGLGDLLHVSRHADFGKNIRELVSRLEELAKGCLPTILAAGSID